MLRLEDLSQHDESGSKLGIRLETCINKDASMFTAQKFREEQEEADAMN